MFFSSLRHRPSWRRLPVLGSFLGFSLGFCPLTALAGDAAPADYHHLADDAEAPDDAGRWSVSAAVHALYASPPGDDSFSANPFGPGLGVRADVTLPSAIYIGASYEHFFGGEPMEWSNIASVRSEGTVDQLTAWGGYELPLDGVTLRPAIGLGYARAVLEDTVTEFDGEVRHERESDGYVIVSPALLLAFPVGAASFNVEGRYGFVPETLADDVLMVAVGFGLDIL